MQPATRSRLTLICILITILLDMIGVGIVIPVLPELIEQLTGGSVAEAAVLGTPAFRINSWAGRTPLTDLSAKYEVAHSFLPEEIDAALEAIEAALDPAAKEEWGRRRDVMLADKVNLTDWYWDLVHEIAG